MKPAPDVWRDLIAYVLPQAMLDTALLLGGVGAWRWRSAPAPRGDLAA